ncbi:MAG: HNH endonuclease [Gaiellaceae bacterium]
MRVCPGCGRLHARNGRCSACEAQRNAQPTRRAHRTAWHRTLRAHVLERDRRTCMICGRPGADTLDYIVPLAHGGEQTAENARAAHLACNSRLGATVRRNR